MRPILAALAFCLLLTAGVLRPGAARAQYWRYGSRPPAAYPGAAQHYFYPPAGRWAPGGVPVGPPGLTGLLGIILAPTGAPTGAPGGYTPNVSPPAPAGYPQGYARPGYPPQGYPPQGGQPQGGAQGGGR